MTDRAKSLDALCDALVQAMHRDGYWEGRLSSSALSTATALSALALAQDALDVERIRSGVAWLAANQNADGGWGDTVDSPSNLATTLLAVAALRLAKEATPTRLAENGHGVDLRPPSPPTPLSLAGEGRCGDAERRAGDYLRKRDADTPAAIVAAVRGEYGDDRTFAVPILMNCALADLVSWEAIAGLPFELALLPQRWYKAVRLHVVSYALPALIAIGLLLHRRHPSKSRLLRWVRHGATSRVLEKLAQIQPEHGGFLEATPLTSFVAMALFPLFGRDQAVAAKCLGFLRQSQRTDGSWPIDTNLSVWLTTASVAALASAGRLSRIDVERTGRWIAASQHRRRHPYTGAEPGGWGWTHLPGGVPDVDDTSGAILALRVLGRDDGVADAVRWLLSLQNSDGGWPTFCRGWGRLPFDRSSPDLTAHALRAIHAAEHFTSRARCRRAIERGLGYLSASQRADGSWIPLWFGNQAAPDRLNPVFGTSRVLRALAVLDRETLQARRGVAYLVAAQNSDGGWGGAGQVASSVEETAAAVAALTDWTSSPAVRDAVCHGADYLVAHAMTATQPAPIGLYFSHLWYSEKLYSLLWTLDALGRRAI